MNAHAIEAVAPDFACINMGRYFRHVHRRVTGLALSLAWSEGLAGLDVTTAGLAGSTREAQVTALWPCLAAASPAGSTELLRGPCRVTPCK